MRASFEARKSFEVQFLLDKCLISTSADSMLERLLDSEATVSNPEP